jgi:hypothetical protein
MRAAVRSKAAAGRGVTATAHGRAAGACLRPKRKHFAFELVPDAGHGPDHPGAFGAERSPDFLDALHNGPVRITRWRVPYCLDEVSFGNDAATMLDQIVERKECLPTKRHGLPAPQQLATRNVEDEIAEEQLSGESIMLQGAAQVTVNSRQKADFKNFISFHLATARVSC